jgi:hypothetical protein
MINPYASFDCLSVGHKLQSVLEDVAEAELHLFTYLACLLSLYRSRPVADWGYQHTSTKSGTPFSYDVANAASQLILSGFFSRTPNGNLQVTDDGSEEYALLLRLSQLNKREAFLEGACSSVLALPVGIVREALLHEPELERATALSSARTLLDGPGLSLLYEQFSALSDAVGVEVKGLMTPSVVWLTYLSRASESLKSIVTEPSLVNNPL